MSWIQKWCGVARCWIYMCEQNTKNICCKAAIYVRGAKKNKIHSTWCEKWHDQVWPHHKHEHTAKEKKKWKNVKCVCMCTTRYCTQNNRVQTQLSKQQQQNTRSLPVYTHVRGIKATFVRLYMCLVFFLVSLLGYLYAFHFLRYVSVHVNEAYAQYPQYIKGTIYWGRHLCWGT